MTQIRPRFTALFATVLAAFGLCASTATASGGVDPFFPRIGDAGYDVGHYDVALSFVPRTGAIRARARIEATAAQALSSFALDLRGLSVRGVEVDGSPARFRARKGKLVVTPATPLAAGAEFTAVVSYGGVPRTIVDHETIRVGWFRTDDGAYTIGEPTGTATWLPCNNVPADKATFSFSLTVPKALKAIANGRLNAISRRGPRTTFTWTESEPMSTYLAVVDIGRGRLTKSRVGKLPSWSLVDSRLVRKARKVLALVPRVIRFDSRIFGPYPFDSTGSIIEFSKNIANLETQTRPIYPYRPAPTVVVHEIAHQWFGDSVGVASWADTWLNEGFATWAQWYWAEKHGGPSAAAELRRYLKPPLYNAGALLPPPGDVGDPIYMFGPTVYNRGAMTLQALRERVGTRTMLRIVREWTSRYRHASADTRQFTEVAEEVSGRDLRAFFEHWLFSPKKP